MHAFALEKKKEKIRLIVNGDRPKMNTLQKL